MKQENIGKKLIKLRVSGDFTCEMISEYLDIPLNQYIEIESGERDITIEQIITLSKFYEVKVHSILFKNTLIS